MDQEKIILVVDDERWFSFEAHYARRCEHAISFIKAHPHVDELWLDCHLKQESITKLLEWLQQECQRGLKPEIGKIVIHSNDLDAADFAREVLSIWYFVEIIEPDAFLDHYKMALARIAG